MLDANVAIKSKAERRAVKRRRKEHAKVAHPPKPPQQPEFTLYCDESGNTGPDYLNEAQPVHVVAGWLVPKRREHQWNTAVAQLRDENGASELKGARLLGTRRGVEIAARILEVSREHGCIPRSLVAFKKHCLSLRVVEIFLDPASNPDASWLPEGADETRREVATLLWTLTPDRLRSFAEPFRTPDPASWRQILLGFVRDLQAASPEPATEAVVANLVRSFRHAAEPAVLDEIIDGERVGASGWGGGKRYEAMSLNFPAFLHLIRQIDPFLEHMAAVCHVVHDETLQFEAALSQGVETFARIGRVEIRSQDGTPWRLSTGCFRSFKTANSRESLGIQAADVLASCVRLIAHRSVDRVDLSESEEDLAALAMGDNVMAAINKKGRGVPGIGSEDDLGHLHVSVLKATMAYLDRRHSRNR
jgi:hypothetical protein